MTIVPQNIPTKYTYHRKATAIYNQKLICEGLIYKQSEMLKSFIKEQRKVFSEADDNVGKKELIPRKST